MYKLLIYLTIDDQFMLVDKFYSDDKEELEELGRIRKENNADYVCVLLGYTLTSADKI